MLNKVSQRVLDAVYARLSNTSNGFNAQVATQAVNYNIDPTFIFIDWSQDSTNFVFDQIDAAAVEGSGIMTYPFSCLYILDTRFTGDQKFNQFSGMLMCVFELSLSWVAQKSIYGREWYSNCVEDAVFDVINRVENQNWGKPLVYNGGIQCRRGPTQYGAQNYRKRLSFLMRFDIHQ